MSESSGMKDEMRGEEGKRRGRERRRRRTFFHWSVCQLVGVRPESTYGRGEPYMRHTGITDERDGGKVAVVENGKRV